MDKEKENLDRIKTLENRIRNLEILSDVKPQKKRWKGYFEDIIYTKESCKDNIYVWG